MMGWSIGYDSRHGRDIGYGVPAICDHPDCDIEIDRGLSYVCGGEPYGGDEGCGLYFCDSHLHYASRQDSDGDYKLEGHQRCERCIAEEDWFTPKPDIPMWTFFKMVDPSWKKWREEEGHSEPTPDMFVKMDEYYKEHGWGKYDLEEA